MFEQFGKIRLRIIRNFLLSCNPDGSVIADLGAGDPAVTDGFNCRKRIKIDINPRTKPDIIHDLTSGIPLKNGCADICVASEILEHIYNSKYFLTEIARILKDRGYLILSCPNICSLKYRLSFLFGKIPSHAAKSDCTYSDDKPGHIRDYNFQEAQNLLETTGFIVNQRKSDGLSYKGRTIIPPVLLPVTFQDSVILFAQKLQF